MPANMIKKRLAEERGLRTSGGLYHLIQIKFAYNSNHIEGCKLTEEQTRLIYETQPILPNNNGEAILIDDIIESSNHFRLFDYILERIDEPLKKEHILEMHRIHKPELPMPLKIGLQLALGRSILIPSAISFRLATLKMSSRPLMNY